TGLVGVDESEPRQPSAQAQDQIARDPFGGREREDGVGIRIVAERGGEGGIDAGAREVNGDVEGVAGAADAEAAVAAANELDGGLADRHHAGSRLVHAGGPWLIRVRCALAWRRTVARIASRRNAGGRWIRPQKPRVPPRRIPPTGPP